MRSTETARMHGTIATSSSEPLNSDIPYDEFVRLQIAGRSDGQCQTCKRPRKHWRLSTGLPPPDYSWPAPTQLSRLKKNVNAVAMNNWTISSIPWARPCSGLTVGCSRCHSHKFDPLPQFDYYRLSSCFADVGFSDTGINMQPEAFRKAKSEFDAAHGPSGRRPHAA